VHDWLLDRRFVSEDGRLSFAVDRDLRVTVRREPGGEILLERAPATWTPHVDPTSEDAHRRLDRLIVELGPEGIGATYELLFARESPGPGPRWVTLAPSTAPADVRVFPEYGGSPFTDDWDWQEGWWCPYSTFRAA
jgi:hypothetical protein